MAIPARLISAETRRAGKRVKIPEKRPRIRSISFIAPSVNNGVSSAKPNSSKKMLARPRPMLLPEAQASPRPPAIKIQLIQVAIRINRRTSDSSRDLTNTAAGEIRVASKAGGKTANSVAAIPSKAPLARCQGVIINAADSIRK